MQPASRAASNSPVIIRQVSSSGKAVITMQASVFMPAAYVFRPERQAPKTPHSGGFQQDRRVRIPALLLATGRLAWPAAMASSYFQLSRPANASCFNRRIRFRFNIAGPVPTARKRASQSVTFTHQHLFNPSTKSYSRGLFTPPVKCVNYFTNVYIISAYLGRILLECEM
jgi:hypothetical protein